MASSGLKDRANGLHGPGPAVPVLPVRAPKELIARIEVWAQKQSDKPSRSEAVRRLIELGLNSTTKRR
jgi:metal-responsive CopG/Arc/MetJ family transcriptional regulator